MTAEGWKGQSIRQHVEDAASAAALADESAALASATANEALAEAGRALCEIEGLQDDLRTLRRQVDGLSQDLAHDSNACSLAASALNEIATLRAEFTELGAGFDRPKLESDGASLPLAIFARTVFVREMIASWRIFLLEARELNAALQEWQTLAHRLPESE